MLRLLFEARGATRTWWLAWVCSWVVASLSARVGIPPVSPVVAADSLALQQLGAIALCLPLVLVAVLMRDSTGWIVAVSPCSHRMIGLSLAVAVTALGLGSVAIMALTYPPSVPGVRVVGLFAFLLGLTLAAGATGHATWSAVPAPLIVIAATVQGLVPWELNLVYNPETTRTLLVVASCALAVGVLAHGATTSAQRARNG